jgi:tetratricopeptide (TPR) repeat protein
MSPEQAAGRPDRIDTRSDVYSLGKMLYELLVGQPAHPLDGTYRDLMRRVANDPVRRPRELAPKLSRELEAVLLKALDPDPERRYPSAGEVASDIDRFLRREPLGAMRHTTAYVLRKWTRRHRWSLTAAVAVLLTIGAMAIASYLRLSAENSRKQAISDVLQFVLEMNDPRNSGGRDMTSELLAGVDERLSSRFGSQPAVEADIRVSVGRTMLSLGKFAAAEAQFERAVKLRREHFGPDDGRTLQAMRNLAEAYRELGKLAEAAHVIRQVLRVRQGRQGEDNERETLRAQSSLAYVLSDMGKSIEAEAPLRTALDGATRRFGDTDRDTLGAAAALVVVLRPHKAREAEDLGYRVLDKMRQTLGPEHIGTLQTMQDLGAVLAVRNNLPEAIRLCGGAISTGERVLPKMADPTAPQRAYYPDLLTWKANLAAMLFQQKELDQAEAIYREILPPSLAFRGETHPFNVLLRADFANLLIDRQKLEEAERLYRDVVRIQEKRAPDDPDTLLYLDALASLLSVRQNWPASVEIYRRTLEVRKKKLPADHPEVLQSQENLDDVLEYQAAAATRPAQPR